MGVCGQGKNPGELASGYSLLRDAGGVAATGQRKWGEGVNKYREQELAGRTSDLAECVSPAGRIRSATGSVHRYSVHLWHLPNKTKNVNKNSVTLSRPHEESRLQYRAIS